MKIAVSLKTRRPRRGFFLIMVLVSLSVLMAMCVAITRSMLVVRRTIELQGRQAQAACLAESGLCRAEARLAADETYIGETWRLAPGDMASREAGVVQIRISKDSGDGKIIHVDADFPDDPIDRSRVSREADYKLNAPATKSK
jgi:Tfp pilus assembly protein PilX